MLPRVWEKEKSTLRKSALAVSILAIALLLVGAIAADAAGKKPFKTGLYVGKTSQGEPVKLKIATCGTNQCVQALESSEIQIQMKCSNGETGTGCSCIASYPRSLAPSLRPICAAK